MHSALDAQLGDLAETSVWMGLHKWSQEEIRRVIYGPNT